MEQSYILFDCLVPPPPPPPPPLPLPPSFHCLFFFFFFLINYYFFFLSLSPPPPPPNYFTSSAWLCNWLICSLSLKQICCIYAVGVQPMGCIHVHTFLTSRSSRKVSYRVQSNEAHWVARKKCPINNINRGTHTPRVLVTIRSQFPPYPTELAHPCKVRRLVSTFQVIKLVVALV